MGTNFYLNIKNKDFAEKYFHGEYEEDNLYPFGYKVHIGKRSVGWKSLYQSHKAAYNSVEEMMIFIRKYYLKELKIYNEYRLELNPNVLKKELIDWDKIQGIRYMKYIPEGVWRSKKYGWKDYFIESTKDDYDTTIPYDHVEYFKFDTHEMWTLPKYYHDKDGYDFTDGDFC